MFLQQLVQRVAEAYRVHRGGDGVREREHDADGRAEFRAESSRDDEVDTS